MAYDPEIDRYIKFTRTDRHQGYGIALGAHLHGASPAEYLDRLILHNQIFKDDVRLDRVVPMPDGKLSIVTSQPRIAGQPATPREIDALMATLGYERLGEGAYLDEPRGILVYDMHPRNVVSTVGAAVVPIDPVIQRITPDFAQFLRNHSQRIHDRP